jgi:hypothetical protein
MKGGAGWRASCWVLGDLGRGREYVVSWKKGFEDGVVDGAARFCSRDPVGNGSAPDQVNTSTPHTICALQLWKCSF